VGFGCDRLLTYDESVNAQGQSVGDEKNSEEHGSPFFSSHGVRTEIFNPT